MGRLSGFSFELRDEYKAEADVVVAIVGGVVVPVSHPAVLRIVVPTAAAKHAIRSLDYFPDEFVNSESSFQYCSIPALSSRLNWQIRQRPVGLLPVVETEPAK